MDNGNIVQDYRNKKKLLAEIGRIQKFASTVEDALEFMELLRFSEDFISLAKKQQLLVAGETGIELSTEVTSEMGNPVLVGISITKLPKNGIQHFTQKLLDTLLQDGFLTMGKGKLTLETMVDAVEFKVLRTPGYYCCHTGEKLDGEKEARAHIKARFAGKASPCKNNPSGYSKDNFYTCQLITATEGEG